MSSVTRSLRPASARILFVGARGASVDELAALLRQEGFEVRSSWVASGQAFQSALRWRPDVILLETRAEPHANSEVFRAASSGSAPVIVLAGAGAPVDRSGYIRAGAAMVVSSQRPIRDVLQAIRRQVNRDRASARAPKAPRLRVPRTDALDSKSNPFSRLTPREQEVLLSLIDGVPASVIAIESSVSVSTVRTQIRSILQKLGVNSQLRAVSLARRAGWPGNDDGAG